MQLVTTPIRRAVLQDMAHRYMGDFVKAVVDVEKEIMVVDAAMHADQEAYLLKRGSLQHNLWGINLYPEMDTDDWIEFDSMINLRPRQGNRTRDIEDAQLRQKISAIVSKLII